MYNRPEMVCSLAERHFHDDHGFSFNVVLPLAHSVTYTNGVGFSIYEFLFTMLLVGFPFSDFEIGILNSLNVCAAQLHYNALLCISLF